MLGFSPDSKVVGSLENEILWLLRKMSLGQHFLVIGFYSQLPKQTSMQQKILREAVSNLQRRWVELVEAKDFVSMFKHATHFSSKFIEKMEDVLVELVESYSHEDQAKVQLKLF